MSAGPGQPGSHRPGEGRPGRGTGADLPGQPQSRHLRQPRGPRLGRARRESDPRARHQRGTSAAHPPSRDAGEGADPGRPAHPVPRPPGRRGGLRDRRLRPGRRQRGHRGDRVGQRVHRRRARRRPSRSSASSTSAASPPPRSRPPWSGCHPPARTWPARPRTTSSSTTSSAANGPPRRSTTLELLAPDVRARPRPQDAPRLGARRRSRQTRLRPTRRPPTSQEPGSRETAARGLEASRDPRVAQVTFGDLSVGVAGKCADQVPALRHLEVGEVRADVRRELAGVGAPVPRPRRAGARRRARGGCRTPRSRRPRGARAARPRSRAGRCSRRPR